MKSSLAALLFYVGVYSKLSPRRTILYFFFTGISEGLIIYIHIQLAVSKSLPSGLVKPATHNANLCLTAYRFCATFGVDKSYHLTLPKARSFRFLFAARRVL
jgi:hypothetical protein